MTEVTPPERWARAMLAAVLAVAGTFALAMSGCMDDSPPSDPAPTAYVKAEGLRLVVFDGSNTWYLNPDQITWVAPDSSGRQKTYIRADECYVGLAGVAVEDANKAWDEARRNVRQSQ
jgi:hypothetical protein